MRVHEGAGDAAHVDALVLEEALVLGGDEGLLHELRDLGERHPVPAAVGLEQLGEFRAGAVQHRGHAGQLQALQPVVVGQVGRRPVVELDHLVDVDDLAVDLLVLAQLLVGEVQVVELDALEAGDFAGRGLLVDHHGVDQAVEIDVLDVERLLHGVAAGAEHGQDLGLVGGGIELCFDGVRPGHDQAEGKGRGEHLNEDRFHVFDETLGRPPRISIIQKGELTVGNSSARAKNIFVTRDASNLSCTVNVL